jgi:hypothetical protein
VGFPPRFSGQKTDSLVKHRTVLPMPRLSCLVLLEIHYRVRGGFLKLGWAHPWWRLTERGLRWVRCGWVGLVHS